MGLYIYICPNCGNKYKIEFPNQEIACSFCQNIFKQAGIYYG